MDAGCVGADIWRDAVRWFTRQWQWILAADGIFNISNFMNGNV